MADRRTSKKNHRIRSIPTRIRFIFVVLGLTYGSINFLLATPLWIFGSADSKSTFPSARQDLVTRSTVEGSISGEVSDFLNNPLLNTDREQAWEHHYQHKNFGNLKLRGNNEDEWAAQYSRDVPGLGGSADATIDSNRNIALQYSKSGPMVSGKGGWSSSEGWFAQLARLWRGKSGLSAKYEVSGTEKNGVKHQLQGAWSDPKQHMEMGVRVPVSSKFMKGESRPEWYVGYERDMISPNKQHERPFALSTKGRISSDGVLGQITAEAAPSKDLRGVYTVKATAPLPDESLRTWFQGTPVDLEHHAHVTYSNAPGSSLYANYQKMDDAPGQLRLGYSMESDDSK